MNSGGESLQSGVIPELSGRELLQRTVPGAPAAFVMLYTPLCGTCKLALRMLEIVKAADPSLPLYRCNLNLSPQLAERWRIESVPCLAYVRGGEETDKLYRMSSVGDLYAWLHRHRPYSTEQ